MKIFRPATECMVSRALEQMVTYSRDQAFFISVGLSVPCDVLYLYQQGMGSGCGSSVDKKHLHKYSTTHWFAERGFGFHAQLYHLFSIFSWATDLSHLVTV